jgi:hypothetical protein
MAYGDLATVSGQNIEAVDADNSNTNHGHYRQHSVTKKKRTGEKKEEEDKQPSPVELGAEDSQVLRIIFVEDPKA